MTVPRLGPCCAQSRLSAFDWNQSRVFGQTDNFLQERPPTNVQAVPARQLILVAVVLRLALSDAVIRFA
jgi:hypothetical protein